MNKRNSLPTVDGNKRKPLKLIESNLHEKSRKLVDSHGAIDLSSDRFIGNKGKLKSIAKVLAKLIRGGRACSKQNTFARICSGLAFRH
jgi:hypothetical protein